jgi:amino acid adenylation domain-containing protein
MLNTTPIAMPLDTIEDKHLLSFMQQGMLFNSLYAPKSGINVEQLICILHEDLNISAFKQAWQQVVDRHPILRTSFCWQDVNEPLQEVQRHVTIPFEQQDWRDLSAKQQEQQLESYLHADRQRGFQVNEAPLMRVALFQIAEANYQCVWTFHHVLLDGRSFPIVLKELFAFYEAFCANQDLQLPQPRPYRDYIDWLRQQDFSKAENFWRSTLNGFSAPTALTVDRTRPVKSDETEDYWYGQQKIRFSRDLTAKLQFLAQQHQLTFNTLVQGAWALLLNRYSGEEDVVFGATRACRRSSVEGADSMIGLLINTLPLRVRVPGEMPLLQWLKELRTQWIALREYEHTPLVKIQGWSDIPAGQPLFESLLVFENYQLNSKLQEQGGKWENREFRLLERTNFPLTVAGYLESELLLEIEYDRHRFDDATIARMLGHIHTLLEGMIANPESRLKDLPLLTAAERHQLLVEWNNTQADYPKDSCYHHLFEAQVERTPEAIAVVYGNQQLTYRELNTRANQLAHYLQKLGVKPDVLVAISVERSIEMVVGFLGILKAGGAYVPLDPTYPHDRRAYKLKDSQAPVILTQERLVAYLPEHNAQVVRLDTDWEVIAQHSEENPVSETTPQNLAYVIYTSGSTGKPKGVMIPHQGLVNHNVAIAKQYELKQSDRVMQFSSMSFDIIIEELFPSWLVGATIVLRNEEILSSTTKFFQFVEQEQLTILNVPTAFWHELVNGLSLLKQPLSASLRLVVVGGEKASRSAYSTWLKLVGEKVRWLNSYGPTETTVTATVYDPIANPETDRFVSEIPIGRPIANYQAYILDRHLQPVPIGVPGELYIGGSSVGRGYLNRPDLNANKFIPNPFSDDPSARIYKTGDTVRYLPDGNIEFIGRIDFQVKIRGFRIELIEIEGALEQHPAVQQTVVLAREDEPGNKRLVAYLVLKPEQSPTTSELRSFLKQKLPEFMIPAAFVMLDTLPLTPNGKVDRRALPAPNPVQVRQEPDETVVAATDELELQLTQIWQQVLGIPAIGSQSNFFELGGHSLLAIRLCNEIENKIGKHLSVATLFQAPTIEQLAHALRQPGGAAVCSSLAVIQPGSSKPPLFCIHVLGKGLEFYRPLARYLDSEQPLYGLAAQMLDKEQAPPNRVEDLAAYYIKEMQTLQPQGPYFIAGVSYGGIVCFEMARQLHEQGQKVALLALFDTLGPGEEELVPVPERALRHLSNIFRFGPSYLLERIKEKLEALYLKVSLLSGRSTSDNLQLIALMQENDEASRNYLPGVYPGRVTIFRATEKVFYTDSYLNSGLGWGKLAAGGVEIHDVPSDHLGILKEPHVKVLAEKLKICLDKLQVATGLPN